MAIRPDGPGFSHELAARERGAWPCAGVDEAGRGPLAGPVVAAAVVLDETRIPEGLDDSKRLTAARRAELVDRIFLSARAVSVASVCAEAIDRTDIRRASLRAMEMAVAGLAIAPGFALIDGRDVPDGLVCDAAALIKGDGRSQSIAAASIVAKVMRDRMMARTCEQFPAYGLSNHAGYGTEAHRDALASHGGIKRLHRFSFAPLRQRELAL